MKATKDYISLETALILSQAIDIMDFELQFESKYVYVYVYIPGTKGEGKLECHTIKKVENGCLVLNTSDKIPAYTWQEILWEYAFDFFGEEVISNHKSPYIIHTNKIKDLLQQKKYEEADIYFRKNCVLINKE